jgi:hypothetical protein
MGEDIYGMTYGNGLFVAVGGDYNEWGSIYTSTDGLTWTKQEETFFFPLYRIIFTGTKFVAVGQQGMIVESDDGLSWTEVSARVTKRSLTSIASGNGLLITTMQYYSSHALYASSDGGVSWGELPSLPGGLTAERIKFMEGLFYAFCGGTVLTSPDGQNWTTFYESPLSNAYLTDLIHENNLYILVGGRPQILTSTDGIDWTERWTGPDWYGFSGVAFGENTFVAVGNFGSVFASEDGLFWSAASIYAGDDFVSVVYGNGQFVAVSHYGAVYSSADGKSWLNRVQGSFSFLSQVIYTQAGFIAVGSADTDFGSYVRLHTSLDGISWTDEVLYAAGGLTGITQGSDGYYASGWWGSILRSDQVSFYADLPIME